MGRAFLIVLDSVGCGEAPDAADFGDQGTNTLAHIAHATGQVLPNLARLGLGAALALSSGQVIPEYSAEPEGLWGVARPRSGGKDTLSGHWDIAGLSLTTPWTVFPKKRPAFPASLTEAICSRAGIEHILGNCHASGTEIISALGERHVQTGWPICYTSSDSVFQVAAHEKHFGLERLHAFCRECSPLLHDRGVARVIARPFIGDSTSGYTRTENRRDFAIKPTGETLFDKALRAGRDTHGVGKIGDIFSMQGIGYYHGGKDDRALMDALMSLAVEAREGAFVFANLVEFDTLYGHRRDPYGYARHLAWFDRVLPDFLGRLGADDIVFITADHGNDPTWSGSDHTRENTPILGWNLGARSVGMRDFPDIGASIAAHLGLQKLDFGASFL